MTAFQAIRPLARAVQNIIWKPLPGSQSMFLVLGQTQYLTREVLFHGSRGNGKSDALIMAFLQHVGKGWGAYWRGIILRKEFKHLADLVKTAGMLIPRIFPGAVWNETKHSWTFPTGEVLIFNHIKHVREYDGKFHGHQYAFIGFDELATWPTIEVYEAMMSTLRTAYQPTPAQPLPPPLQVRSTTNPWGAGRTWVYERFIEGRKPGEITYNQDGTRQRTALFGTIFQNHYIDDGYIRNYLAQLTDPAKRAAWLEGDWEAVDTGAMFGPVWSQNLLLDPFQIPAAWKVDRCFDFGQSTPFCCLWVAESNGESVRVGGREFCPPKGSLIVVGEDYGTEIDPKTGKQARPDAGLFLSAKQIGARLKQREKKLQETVLVNHQRVIAGPADNQIFNGSKVDQGNAPTVAKELKSEGMDFTNSDKSPGSRVTSAQLMFGRLQATKVQDPSNPHIYFFPAAKFLVKTLPFLQRDDDQLDAVAKGPDDHAWDALAYRLTWKRPHTAVKHGIMY